MASEDVSELHGSLVRSWRALLERLAGEFPHARQHLSDAFMLAEDQMRQRSVGTDYNWEYRDVDVQQTLDLVAATEPAVDVASLRELFQTSHRVIKALYDLNK